jgi:hypothetical protein
MATNLAIDDALIEEARVIGGLTTKKAVVTQALMEYIQKRKMQAVIDLFGTIDFDEDFDYKELRKRPRGAVIVDSEKFAAAKIAK